MKSKFIFSLILVAGLMLVSFSVNNIFGQTPQIKAVKLETLNYVCPQHPEVVQDKAGKCPKCGMTLVDKKEKTKENKDEACDSTKMKSQNKKMMSDSTDMK